MNARCCNPLRSLVYGARLLGRVEEQVRTPVTGGRHVGEAVLLAEEGLVVEERQKCSVVRPGRIDVGDIEADVSEHGSILLIRAAGRTCTGWPGVAPVAGPP